MNEEKDLGIWKQRVRIRNHRDQPMRERERGIWGFFVLGFGSLEVVPMTETNKETNGGARACSKHYFVKIFFVSTYIQLF